MAPRSRLHVPHPPARPGQEPDFSYLEISPAGAVNRPDITASARDIENLSLEMVRVAEIDRKSTRLNSSHSQISYAVFCLKKKKKYKNIRCCSRCRGLFRRSSARSSV